MTVAVPSSRRRRRTKSTTENEVLGRAIDEVLGQRAGRRIAAAVGEFGLQDAGGARARGRRRRVPAVAATAARTRRVEPSVASPSSASRLLRQSYRLATRPAARSRRRRRRADVSAQVDGFEMRKVAGRCGARTAPRASRRPAADTARGRERGQNQGRHCSCGHGWILPRVAAGSSAARSVTGANSRSRAAAQQARQHLEDHRRSAVGAGRVAVVQQEDVAASRACGADGRTRRPRSG